MRVLLVLLGFSLYSVSMTYFCYQQGTEYVKISGLLPTFLPVHSNENITDLQ